MAQMYIYRRKSDGRLEAIAGISQARPEADYDRFPVSRDQLGGRGPNQAFAVVGGKLAARTPTLDEAKAAGVAAAIEALEANFDRRWPAYRFARFEKDTWNIQLAEARAFQADHDAPTPWLTATLKTGETIAELAAKVLANHEAFKDAVAGMILARRTAEAAIEAAATAQEIEQYLAAFVGGLE